MTLLGTHDGQYAAACSLDFSKPPSFYDTFALRDAEGNEPLMQTWPYFRSRASRRAVKLGVPVPVSSCWNGASKQPLPLQSCSPTSERTRTLSWSAPKARVHV